MPTYNIRLYRTLCDEYDVEAASEQEAWNVLDKWQQQTGNAKALPSALNDAVQEIVTEEEYDSRERISVYDAEGNLID